MARMLLLIIALSAVVLVRSIDNSGSGDSMDICDDIPSCQSIDHATVVHIELVLLDTRCENDRVQSAIRCDIDDVLSDVLSEVIVEASSDAVSCTILKDNGTVCIALTSVLEDSAVSQNLTQELYNELEANKTLLMDVNITFVNVTIDTPAGPSSDEDFLNLQLYEGIIILVAIVLAVIGFCFTLASVIGTVCRRVRKNKQPVKPIQLSRKRKVSIQDGDNVQETTDTYPFSPDGHEMNTFRMTKKEDKDDQLQVEASRNDKTLLTVQQLHDSIKDLPKLHEEFESLPKFIINDPSAAADKPNESSDTVIENQNKMQEYAPSHVKLSSKYSSDELAPNHINANYIKGYNAVEKCYIVTCGPDQNSANDFWQMVWEQKPVAIAMLQQKDESFIYWPDTSETLRQEFGLITVTVRKRVTKPEYIVTTLRLLHAEENEEHVDVVHYWYAKWTTEQFPTDTSGVIAFLKEINETRKSCEGPLVVHCSDGLSCSGTLIAIDIARHQLENDRKVDIANIVSNIREDRGGMIVTKQQYVYIYQVLNDWIEDLLKLEPSMSTEKTASTDHLVP